MKQIIRFIVKSLLFIIKSFTPECTSGDFKHEAFHGPFLMVKVTHSFLNKTLPSICVHMLQCFTMLNIQTLP